MFAQSWCDRLFFLHFRCCIFGDFCMFLKRKHISTDRNLLGRRSKSALVNLCSVDLVILKWFTSPKSKRDIWYNTIQQKVLICHQDSNTGKLETEHTNLVLRRLCLYTLKSGGRSKQDRSTSAREANSPPTQHTEF